ncbi:MAG: glycosyltransferase family 4 protein [Planctomycetes bacterium]|nr:glycosyltransferase family 4 protein [Planctomycetota bacterium]
MPGREILVVLDYLDPEALGGAARVALEESRALARRGHRITIIAGSRSGGEISLAPGIRFVRYRYEQVGERGPGFLRGALLGPAAAPGRCPEARPDAVLLHQPLSGAIACLRPAIARPASVYHFHSPWAEEWQARRGRACGWIGWPALLRQWIERIALTRTDRVTVASRYMASRLAAWHPGLPVSRVDLVPLGVDVETFRPLGDPRAMRAKVGLPADRPIAITVRRLTRRMGLENLIEAAARLAIEIPDLLLIIVGEGELRPVLEEKIAGLGLGASVRMWGYARAEELIDLYNAADVFVLPTAALEGFGLVTLEALACGLPVLGTPIGGTAEILSRLDGDLLFDDASPQAIARKVSRFIREGWGARFSREAMRAFAVRDYAWDRVADALEGMIAARRGSRPPAVTDPRACTSRPVPAGRTT